MLSLLDQAVLSSLREKLPTRSGTLLILTLNAHLPRIRNLLALSLPEGTKFKGGCWNLPSGERVFVRDLEGDLTEPLDYDLAVCTGGEIPAADLPTLKSWRERDALAGS